MPMRSEAQRRFLWAKHPGVAKRFEAETPDEKKLPDRAVEREAFRKAIKR